MNARLVPPLALVAAFVLDLAFGEPPNRVHPVAWLGGAIGKGRDWALAANSSLQLVRGALVAIAACAAAAAFAETLVRPVAAWPWASFALTALVLKPLFAVRALRDAAFAVRDALARGDIARARAALSSLCSRDAASLGAPSLCAAAVESLAENASDSIVAPFFYYTFFGLKGAAFYRAANTLDAMIGYHGKLERVGKFAARLDDVLNLVPARFTAFLLLTASFGTTGARRGFAVLFRDGGRTESPNAGRPMAAMAGLLGVQLSKENAYRLGDPLRPIETRDITLAWRLVLRATFLALFVAVAVLVLRGRP
jgi:adenosylcobinamide-phosphate synthase